MELWVEKYRPQVLEDYVGNEVIKNKIADYIKESSIQNLLFYGVAGTGKTTLAKLITKNIDCDLLYLNASDERGIDTIREKIQPFAASMGFNDTSLKNSQLGDKIIEALSKKTKLSIIRQILADSGAREFDGLFKVLYDNVSKYTNREGEAILIIAKYQYEYTFVLEKEICIAAMLNKLLDICS
jgi:Cdc6-like AAA superfamily ATPase